MRLLLTTFGLLSACENISKEDSPSDDTGDIITDTNDLESGCFIVDGGSGYALLNDAISMANDDSVITMDGCSAIHEEVVNVTKRVSIVGPGSDSFTLTPPTNENGFNITASGASISGVSITSTRSGISIEGASLVNLDDIVVPNAGNWAIKATSAEAEISNSLFTGNGFGGISADSSTLTIVNTDINDNTSYGIYGISGSTIDIDATNIIGTLSSGSEDTQDGIAAYIESNSILLANNSDLSSSALFSTYSVNASTFLTDVIAGQTQFGAIWAEGTGELSLNGVTIEEAPGYGIIAQITGAVSIENTTLNTDPALSPSTDAETWRDEGFLSMGLFTNSPAVTVNNFSISGYNNCGAYFTTNEADAQLAVDGLNITEVGRLGTYVIGYDGEMNNVTIDQIYDLDGASDPEVNSVCSFVDRYVGAVIVDNIDLNNLTLTNIEGYGLTAIQSSTVIDTLVAENNTCGSIMAFEAALFLSNAEFALPNAKQYNLGASVVGYNATTLSVDQSSFEGLPYTESQYDYLMYTYNTSDVQVSNTSFSNGYYGLFSDTSELTLSDNTFSNISGIATYLGSSSSGNHLIERTTFEGGPDTQSYYTYCFDGGQVEIRDSSYSNMSSDAVYMNRCSTELDTVSFSDIGGAALYIYDGDHEWDKLTLNNVGIENFASGAIELRALSGPSLMSLSSSDFDTVGSDAVYIYSYGTSYPITAYIDDVTISNTIDDGIYSYGVDVQLSNSSISNTGGEGLSVSGNSYSISNTNITAVNDNGIYCSNASLSLSNTSIDNANASAINAVFCPIDATTLATSNSGQYGFNLSYSSLDGSDVTVDTSSNHGIFGSESALSLTVGSILSAGGDGISLSGTASAIALDQVTVSNSTGSGIRINTTSGSITNSTIGNSTEYGLFCTDSGNTFCNNNTLQGNVLGEQTGCDLSCGIEANPVDPPTDTGSTDTGDTGTEPPDTSTPPPPPIDTGDTGL